VATSPDPRKEVRQWILAILKAVGAPAFHKYVGTYAARSFLLRAARVHAATASQRAKTGKCPDLTARAQAVDDVAMGRPMRVTRGSKGVLTLQPPAEAGGVLGKYYDLSYALTCK
jgi:hypothetical protein